MNGAVSVEGEFQVDWTVGLHEQDASTFGACEEDISCRDNRRRGRLPRHAELGYKYIAGRADSHHSIISSHRATSFLAFGDIIGIFSSGIDPSDSNSSRGSSCEISILLVVHVGLISGPLRASPRHVS